MLNSENLGNPKTEKVIFRGSLKGNSEQIDPDTLNGITREDSPYYGNLYPFRFLHPREYESQLQLLGLKIQHCEVITKTYNRRQENFSFVSIEAVK